MIDGKCVYEIDEECVKRHRLPRECGIYEHLRDDAVKPERSGKDMKREPK